MVLRLAWVLIGLLVLSSPLPSETGQEKQPRFVNVSGKLIRLYCARTKTVVYLTPREPTITIVDKYHPARRENLAGWVVAVPPCEFRLENVPAPRPGVIYLASHRVARLLRRPDVLCVDSGEFLPVRYETHPEYGAGDLETLAIELRSYDPTAFVAGFPDGKQFEEKQRRMLFGIRQRYEEQVGDVLLAAAQYDANRE